MLTLTACDPGMTHLDKSELENKVVKVELIHYDYPKQKQFKSWVPDHSKKLKPFEEVRVVVLEELPSERMSEFLDRLSEADVLVKYWAVDSPRCFCLRLTYDDGSFLILNCYGHSYRGYIGTYASDGEVQDFIGWARRNGISYIELDSGWYGPERTGDPMKPNAYVKPVIDYALCIDQLGYATSHTFTDMPYYLYGGNVLISNYDHAYYGDMLMTEALGRSQNTPAVQALAAVVDEKGEAVEWKLVEDRRMGGERWGVSEDGGTLEVRRGGGSIVSGPEYGSCIMHVEFKTSYMPEARGQGRCNSGVYTQGRIEMQILDSYALEGRDNECGGIYQQSRPIVNMCLPPETWQTYDIDYTAAKFDAEGKVIEDAILTVRQNGVLIHDHLRVKPTPGGLGGTAVPKGPLMLQDHGNTLWFRNLWFKEK